MPKLQLHWQILIAICLGIAFGYFGGREATFLGLELYAVYSFVGTLFLNALKMIIVPLIAASIISGAANLGGANMGRMGGKTLGFYLCSSLVAILIGLVMVNLISPGTVEGVSGNAQTIISQNQVDTAALSQKVAGRSAGDVIDIFVRMVPPNIVHAAAQGQMLGLIFFCLLFGALMHRVEQPYQDTVLNFWEGTFRVMMEITMLIMRFAPIGVFGLVAKTIATTGLEAIEQVGWFFLTVVLALATHAFVAVPLVLSALARVNPLDHYRAMGPALLTAFSTASSSATLPLTVESVEKEVGVSQRTSSFVLPLGATVNMDGTALYECVAAMFIAQVYGIELGFTTQFMIVMIALLTSIGVAGIPSASLVAISIILAATGVPMEGIGLLMITDRILDMMRTSVNVLSDSVCAVVIARSEGESGFYGKAQQ